MMLGTAVGRRLHTSLARFGRVSFARMIRMLSIVLAVLALPPCMSNAVSIPKHRAVHPDERWRHQSEPVVANGGEFGLHDVIKWQK
jgi:hypothetical protein